MPVTPFTPHQKALIFTQWTAALRSGQYPQAKGALRKRLVTDDATSYGYCCLGVLCEIDPTIKRDDHHTISYYSTTDDLDSNDLALPRYYAEALDITDIGMMIVHKPDDLPLWLSRFIDDVGVHRFSLANLNDDTHASPAQIADVIDMARTNDLIGFVPNAHYDEADE